MTKNIVTIVIPARNEEEVIVKTLDRIRRIVYIPYELIIVDDMSTDATGDVIVAYKKNKPEITLTSTTSRKHGFSSAIEKGVRSAKTEFVVIVMADLCDDPKTINKMYKKMHEGWDIVCGSRYVRGGKKTGGPAIQGFLSKFVCRSLNFFGVPTKDVSNAFKMYRRKVFRNVSFNSKSGVEASMELTLQAYFNGARITDLPTVWQGRTIGKSKFKIFQRAPKYMRIYLWVFNNLIRQKIGLKYKKYQFNAN